MLNGVVKEPCISQWRAFENLFDMISNFPVKIVACKFVLYGEFNIDNLCDTILQKN